MEFMSLPFKFQINLKEILLYGLLLIFNFINLNVDFCSTIAIQRSSQSSFKLKIHRQ